MPFEEFSVIISELRKKLFYIAAVFGAGTIFSFSFMGDLIKKIEFDMFWRMNLQAEPYVSRQLVDISNNISSISEELAANNSIIAQNLTKISGELLNISQHLNLYKPNIIYLTPMEVLMLEFKMSLMFGVLFASPLISYYAYRGIKGRFRGVIPLKRSFIIPTAVASMVLFLLGVVYSYFYMLPFFLRYLYQDAISLGITANFSIYQFIYFVVMTTIVIGLSFELPVILTLLVRLGVTSRTTLAHYRRHAYIILLIVAAWITPGPDIFSQIMVTLPFIVLYEVSLLVIRLTGK